MKLTDCKYLFLTLTVVAASCSEDAPVSPVPDAPDIPGEAWRKPLR